MSDQVDVLWVSRELGSAEHCTMRWGSADRGIADRGIEGTVVLPRRGIPARIDYSISISSDWRVRAATIELVAAESSRTLTFEHTDRGWLIDGLEHPGLGACIDLDLGWTPATNTIPLRRSPLEEGRCVTTTAAWVRFPELDVVVSEQNYTRLAGDRVRYRSSTFEADLTVTQENIVADYGDGLWVAEAIHRH